MNAFIQELFHAGIYKRTQGRITRQVTFFAVVLAVVFGAWRLNQVLGIHTVLSYAVPGAIVLVGAWLAYRIVNVPAFADFLIAVEAEMNKVSWPTRTELTRASIVVLVTLFVLAAVLLVFDTVWTQVFKVLGIL